MFLIELNEFNFLILSHSPFAIKRTKSVGVGVKTFGANSSVDIARRELIIGKCLKPIVGNGLFYHEVFSFFFFKKEGLFC